MICVGDYVDYNGRDVARVKSVERDIARGVGLATLEFCNGRTTENWIIPGLVAMDPLLGALRWAIQSERHRNGLGSDFEPVSVPPVLPDNLETCKGSRTSATRRTSH